MRNVKTAVSAAKKEGAEVQLAMAYTLGEGYNIKYWINLASEMESMGADSICLKDMAGLLTPEKTGRLIGALKETVKVPVWLHSHCTNGMAPISYVKAVEAGCDGIDTAISAFASGSSQPATEIMVETFEKTPYDTGIEQTTLKKIADYFKEVRDKLIEEGSMDTKILEVDMDSLYYQVPGGMLSNLISQLKQQNAMDKLSDILEEIPKVRKDLGEPPLVTPSSQIVGTQAAFNVLSGERYKIMSRETRAVLRGNYGKTMKPFNVELQKKVIGDEKPISCRPADLLEPELNKLKKELAGFETKEEDVLSYALSPQGTISMLKKRKNL